MVQEITAPHSTSNPPTSTAPPTLCGSPAATPKEGTNATSPSPPNSSDAYAPSGNGIATPTGSSPHSPPRLNGASNSNPSVGAKPPYATLRDTFTAAPSTPSASSATTPGSGKTSLDPLHNQEDQRPKTPPPRIHLMLPPGRTPSEHVASLLSLSFRSVDAGSNTSYPKGLPE